MNNYVPSHFSPIIIFPLDVKVSSVNKRVSPGKCPGLLLVSSLHCWALIGCWGEDDRDMMGHFPDKPHWLTDNSKCKESWSFYKNIICIEFVVRMLSEFWLTPFIAVCICSASLRWCCRLQERKTKSKIVLYLKHNICQLNKGQLLTSKHWIHRSMI